VSEWQPIETAPKDGTSVILWVDGGGWYIGFWDGRSWTDGNYFDRLDASLWCPLPPPPKGEGS